MQKSTAKIVNLNEAARSSVASAARISTQSGTALEIFARSGDAEKDINLVRKVVASGHRSVTEHQTFAIAFNDVSVMVEQFMIEFRLASFTVKSRRYVDFSTAGFVIPAEIRDTDAYCVQMESLFGVYEKLMALGVPKEDARFVLPYCLRSNFFVTVNARELMLMLNAMRFGRGARFAEIRALGEQLRTQFEAVYPGILDMQVPIPECEAPLRTEIQEGEACTGAAEWIAKPANTLELLESAMRFSGRFHAEGGRFATENNLAQLIMDPRPRELEILNYTFKIRNASLACLTHFTRHRMQSLLIPSVLNALCDGNYVLPDSVRAIPEAEKLYREAFKTQAIAAKESQLPAEALIYYAMSGHTLDFMLTANARELLHFAKLRTCTRAQWEIRHIARQMVAMLAEACPAVFARFGPSCAVSGKCPEGRMSCGHPVRIQDGIWKTRGKNE